MSLLRRVILGPLGAAIVILGLAGGGAAAGDAFVAGTEDLPLMPGLEEVAGGALLFDTPDGRIVEAYAEGDVKPDQVLRFYAATLPELGWAPLGKALYRREKELLRLEFSGGTPLVVHFAISPE